MLDAIEANGWLQGAGGMITGYLPSPGHVEFASGASTRLKKLNPAALTLWDPVLGDDPGGLYIERLAAELIRRTLPGTVNITTPNRFELEWLSGMPVENVKDAVEAAGRLRTREVLATSIPDGSGRLATVLTTPEGAAHCTVPRRNGNPHGAGDLLSACYMGHRLAGATGIEALQRSATRIDEVVAASEGCDRLNVAACLRPTAPSRLLPLKLVILEENGS